MKQMKPETWRLSHKDVVERINLALSKLCEEDNYLFTVDANERSISFRLGFHLQAQFPDCDVDCEYNRTGKDFKEVYVDDSWEPVEPDDDTGRTVFPDIIVHQRGLVPKRNLLIIEMKKLNAGKIKIEKDIKKLKAYMTPDNLEYRFGVLVLLEIPVPRAFISKVLPEDTLVERAATV